MLLSTTAVVILYTVLEVQVYLLFTILFSLVAAHMNDARLYLDFHQDVGGIIRGGYRSLQLPEWRKRLGWIIGIVMVWIFLASIDTIGLVATQERIIYESSDCPTQDLDSTFRGVTSAVLQYNFGIQDLLLAASVYSASGRSPESNISSNALSQFEALENQGDNLWDISETGSNQSFIGDERVDIIQCTSLNQTISTKLPTRNCDPDNTRVGRNGTFFLNNI